MLVLSACLAGVPCKYSGGDNLIPCGDILKKHGLVLLICPEVAGGLSVPRPAAEIKGSGGGQGVWEGTARVYGSDGTDLTHHFTQGALNCLEVIKRYQPESVTAVMKARSPSCGSGRIYDGTFSGQLVPGDGVAVSLFRRHGITVIDEHEFMAMNQEEQ